MSALKTDFAGEKGDLFALALKTGFLTILTFGLYRFWAKTRLRRWYWSAIRPGGLGLEYLGSAHEKIMGFFVAIIVLALYLSVFNLVGLELVLAAANDTIGLQSFGLAALILVGFPLFFMARYRSRRYLLSRTTWLGVRLGMDAGAWGYAWRACLYWALTILSLGLFWPLKTFQLEKYVTNHSWYGTAQFKQHGNPLMLYGLAVPFLACIGGYVYLAYVAIQLPTTEEATLQDLELMGWLSLGAFCLFPVTLLAGAYFRVASIRAMAGLKELGDGMEFDLNPRTRKLLKIRIFGSLITAISLSFVSSVVIGLIAGVMMLLGYELDINFLFNTPPHIAMLAGTITGLLTYVLWGVFWHAFVTFPSTRHIAETLVIDEPMLLQRIRQRQDQSSGRMGILSEALDVGGAF